MGLINAGFVGPNMTPAVKASAIVVVMTARKIRTSMTYPLGVASTVGSIAAAAGGSGVAARLFGGRLLFIVYSINDGCALDRSYDTSIPIDLFP